MIKSSLSGAQEARAALKKEMARIADGFANNLTIGIHEGEGDSTESGLSMAGLGAVHQFGASIDHPGGTRYVSTGGKAKFVSNSFTGPVTGVTKAHKITIPARPWLDVGVASGESEYAAIFKENMGDIASGKTSVIDVLNIVGVVAVSKVQEFMINLTSPANAASTVRAKGSSNPLIDSGAMMQSVGYAVTKETLKEGI